MPPALNPLRSGLLALGATLLLAAPAGAATFTQSDDIHIDDVGAATQYPSEIEVRGLAGPITDVNVTLGDVDHDFPEDLDILVVAPDDTGVILTSDRCFMATGTTGVTWEFDQAASNPIPELGECNTDATYRPADTDTGGSDDTFPAISRIVTSLDELNSQNPDGFWRLYVWDDEIHGSAETPPTGFSISSWTLDIEVGGSAIQIPAVVDGTAANPYPVETLVDFTGTVLTDLDVLFDGMNHDQIEDFDMFLEGPGGQKVWLVSDVCAGGPGRWSSFALTLDDESPFGPLPQDAMEVGDCEKESWRPTNRDTGPNDGFPEPAPAAPDGGATSLSAFDLTDPNGVWKLWIAADDEDSQGYVVGGHELRMAIRPAAPAGFSPGAVTGAEGTSVFVDVVRSLVDGSAGRGEITIATSSGTAAAGEDFAPVSQTVVFEPGETRKTVEIPILGGVPHEPLQGFSVTLANPEGDIRVDTPAAAGITIPADPDFDDPPPNSFDPPPPVTFTASGSTTIPSVRKCKRRGQTIRFRPHNSDGLAIVRSQVYVNNKLIEDNVGDAAIAPIVLTMKGKRMRVRIRLTSHDGRVVTIRRTFRRCKKRRR